MSCAKVRCEVRRSVLLLVVFALLGAQRAGAHAESPLPPEYEGEISAAVDEHDAGHFEAARAHFIRAHEVFPNARTLRGLGKVEFELRNYVVAQQYLEQALTSPVRPLPDELREEVAQLLTRALAATASIALTVRPASALVSLDGAAVSIGSDGRLAVNEGDHVLEFHASGYLTERRPLHVHSGERVTLQVALAGPQLTPPHEAPTAQRDAPPPVYRQWWFWTLTGVAAAGVTATAVLLATRDRPPQPTLDWTVANP